MRSRWLGLIFVTGAAGLTGCPDMQRTDGGDTRTTDAPVADRPDVGTVDMGVAPDAVDIVAVDMPIVLDTGGDTPDVPPPMDVPADVPADVRVDAPADVPVDMPPTPILLGPSHGSAIAFTPDDLHAVAVNRGFVLVES